MYTLVNQSPFSMANERIQSCVQKWKCNRITEPSLYPNILKTTCTNISYTMYTNYGVMIQYQTVINANIR